MARRREDSSTTARRDLQVAGAARQGPAAAQPTHGQADADATAAQAVRAGATLERSVTTNEHGARCGWIVDPFG